MADHRLHHRNRIGEAGGLYHHPRKWTNPTGLHAVHQIGERIHQFAANRAAKASVRQFYNTIAGAFDQKVVNADIAEFIDDQRRIAEPWFADQPVEKRGFARPEKPGQDRNRNSARRVPAGSARIQSLIRT
jgi:hypothetical protein